MEPLSNENNENIKEKNDINYKIEQEKVKDKSNNTNQKENDQKSKCLSKKEDQIEIQNIEINTDNIISTNEQIEEKSKENKDVKLCKESTKKINEISNEQIEKSSLIDYSSSSSHSEFYKEVFITDENVKNDYLINKNPNILNYKNYFNLKNTNDDDPDDLIPKYECEICHLKDTGMLLCDNCFGAVHDNCLKKLKKLNEIKNNSDNDSWLCDRCQYLLDREYNSNNNNFANNDCIQCCYCPENNFYKGLMTIIENDQFAHFDCYNFFNNSLINKEYIVKKNNDTENICEICGLEGNYLTKCQYDKCNFKYHYKCGIKFNNKQALYCKEHLLKVDEILLLNKKRMREKK